MLFDSVVSHLYDRHKSHRISRNLTDTFVQSVCMVNNSVDFLPKLNIYDNNIRAAGAQAIAHALTKNTLLTKLNIRLNRLGDEGGQAICRALLKNTNLSELNLGSNELSEPTAATLSQVVVQNTTLRNVELSCNRLGPVGDMSTHSLGGVVFSVKMVACTRGPSGE